MTQKYYPDVQPNPDFAQISQEILEFWQKDNTFVKSVENRTKGESEFIFYDGPPFANGLPHYGHLLTGFVKDIIARYQTLKGKRVERKFGWDCHGLPVEMEVEKELGISGRVKILEYGIEKFNAECRKSVLKYVNEWEEYITNQGRWVDFKNSYKTMDLHYMESILWAFKQLYDKGLVYQSNRVLPYSWACHTPLSNFETRMDNCYRKVTSKAITVKFTLKNLPKNLDIKLKKVHLLAWTTTPWTLPSNLALAVNEAMDYVCVEVDKEYFILSVGSQEKYSKELNNNIITQFKGSELVNLEYQPLFEYFKDHENAFKILAADFVVEGEGTGIVHCAPGFGEDDQILCQSNGITLVCPVDESGKFTQSIPDFAGVRVFEANDKIIIALKNKGQWLRTEQYIHNYPHCWRTDTPLIYKAVPSWYIKVTEFKDKLLKANAKINWIPTHIKEGLFGKWLENARDWSISRNRFWGTPIPIWVSDDPQYPRIDVYGSLEGIEKDFNVKISDLHRPFIDELTRKNPDDPSGKSIMRRVTDVFDCWFDSGAMPYAQKHYPFENKEIFEKKPYADFIVEYSAQTRGWFYTLTVLAAALFDAPAFLNCICHGVILDTKGQKLSKRLKNYIDPKDIFAKYGSDALRFFMASSSVMRGQELYIDSEGKMVADTLRLVLKPIWNAYNFFTLYANADFIKAKHIIKSRNLNDLYILAKLKRAVQGIEKFLDEYDLPNACKIITEFFEILNNWYIRRNRARFWRSEKDQDKQEAYDTLFTVLKIMSISAAPLLPIILDKIYIGLTATDENSESVHLQDYPNVGQILENEELVKDIDFIRNICNAGLNIRNLNNIRIRQPLSKLLIVSSKVIKLDKYFDLIKDELNVKVVEFSNEFSKYASNTLKINFKIVSLRLAHKMKDLIDASKSNNWSRAGDKIRICSEELTPGEYSLNIEAIGNSPSCAVGDGETLVILDTHITQELAFEGIARDLIRIIQQARKTADLHISDQIDLYINFTEEMRQICEKFKNLISEQTLAKNIIYKIENTDYIIKEIHNIEENELTLAMKYAE